MTDFRDLVNRAWMHAKNGDLYLAGWDSYLAGGAGPVFSPEPTAYTEGFIAGIERTSGMVFERVLLGEREQLEHEFNAVKNAYAFIEAKNYWSDDDRRRWRDLGMRHADLRRAIQAYDAIEDEDEREAALADSQFGVGA